MHDFTSPVIEGHFLIEAYKGDKVVDRFEDHNMIMDTARQSMAEIFAMLGTSVGAHKIVIGTHGAKDDSIYQAKTSEDGFVRERTRIFSEYDDVTYAEGTIFPNMRKGDIIRVSMDEMNNTYYRYNLDSEDVVVDYNKMLTDSVTWTKLTTAPYTHIIEFTLPGKNSDGKGNCNIITDTSNTRAFDIVRVDQKSTSVIFTFYIDTANGNDQYKEGEGFDTPTTVFNEAGLYVNNRLFAFKTFPSKIKDNSIKLKLVWTITF